MDATNSRTADFFCGVFPRQGPYMTHDDTNTHLSTVTAQFFTVKCYGKNKYNDSLRFP